MNDKQKLIAALIEQPSRYKIDVQDSTMLPDNLKQKKEIEFVVKPPSIGVLALCASEIQNLPNHLTKPEAQISFVDALPYCDSMIRVICILSHAKESAYPDWYEPFIKNNCTPKDIYHIFQETTMKMQSDFFLHSFQIASLTNPMMMNLTNPEG